MTTRLYHECLSCMFTHCNDTPDDCRMTDRNKPEQLNIQLNVPNSWNKQEDGNHYKNMKIQPMEYSMANNLNSLQHTIIKYVSRYKDKHDDPTIDLKKAKHCLEMLIEWESK